MAGDSERVAVVRELVAALGTAAAKNRPLGDRAIAAAKIDG